jgi:phosphatidylinositol-3-phosphatase
MRTWVSALLLVLLLSGCHVHRLPKPLAQIARAPLPSFKHVFVVVEENENYADVIGNSVDMPYLNMLAAKFGLATNYFANTHPSINNYFLLTAGRIGIRAPWIFRDLSDLYPFDVEGENIASVLLENRKTWKSYAESIPFAAYIGDDQFPYVKRHNPFAYFETVRGDASQRANIVPFETFKRDLQLDRLPDYSFVVPNIYNDGHHDAQTAQKAICGDHLALRNIDTWLRKNMNPLVESATFQRGGLLIIVFDEACEYGPHADWRFDPNKPQIKGGGQVAAVIVSSRTPPGTKSDKVYHHESVLRLSLRALGVEHLPGLAVSSPDMDDFFPH